MHVETFANQGIFHVKEPNNRLSLCLSKKKMKFWSKTTTTTSINCSQADVDKI